MALQHPSAPTRAASRVRSGTARSGVTHVNTWHTRHFTVVGNHLLQHPELSATAIGVAAHIQSLPDGAPVGVKALTERFPEGQGRMASALRELELHGYLERRRERLGNGQVVTLTYSYNKPGSVGPEDPPPDPSPAPGREPEPEPEPEAVPESVPVPQAVPESEPEAVPEPECGPVVPPGPGLGLGPAPGLGPVPGLGLGTGPGPGPVNVCEPVAASAPRQLHPGAADLLAGLRRYDPRLLLAERDVRRLAPGVSDWLERGAEPEAVGRVLCADLPARMRHPASLLAYRLSALVPPHLPPAPAAGKARRPDPFQTCDGCDRAFRARTPGRCRDCPPGPAAQPAA